MLIGIVDTDLLDNGTRHPNLALMKISAFQKEQGNTTRLVLDYDELKNYDEVYVSKVFTRTNFPQDILSRPNIHYGGTGFFFDKAPGLPEAIEHHMPDYHLYDEYVHKEIERGIKRQHFRDYIDYSIGFATRGCFRKCNFCVNQKYEKVSRHSPITEFFDPERKYIYLWDDNVLGYIRWKDIFAELEETGRRFQFRQGMDMRLMTEDKASILTHSKYFGDFIFAFDSLADKPIMEKKLAIWRRYNNKTTKLYVLCAYDSNDVSDIVSIFERIKVLMSYRCIPYIMRYDGWDLTDLRGMYINLARWCNQPDFFKKKSFREYCEANGENSATMDYLRSFEAKCPEVGKNYFDLRYDQVSPCF